jgi:hypothetical protein
MPTLTLAPDVSRLTQKPRPVVTDPPVTAAPATTAPATTASATAPVAGAAATDASTNAKMIDFLNQNKIYIAVGVVATIAIIYFAATYNSDA